VLIKMLLLIQTYVPCFHACVLLVMRNRNWPRNAIVPWTRNASGVSNDPALSYRQLDVAPRL
jgi:hypothetical protein